MSSYINYIYIIDGHGFTIAITNKEGHDNLANRTKLMPLVHPSFYCKLGDFNSCTVIVNNIGYGMF